VNAPFELAIIAVFLLFCRIGACIMMLPGFSNDHIPMRVRLYIAIGVTLPLAPMLVDALRPQIAGMAFSAVGFAAIGEVTIGFFLGSLARLFLFALETVASAIVMAIGLGNVLSGPISESESLPALASFVTIGAVTMIFVSNQHWELIRGLYLSYSAIPLLAPHIGDAMLPDVTRVLERSYFVALRIGSPFLLFGLVANLSFGFLNRMAPQIPVYFLSGPFIIALGLYVFYAATPDFFAAFSHEFGGWLLHE
jgi:flagellar biosynthetic protein FliR